MTWTEEEAARLRAHVQAPFEAPQGEDCPDPERLWAAAAGELERQDAAEVVEHLASCDSCQEDWRIGQDLGGFAEAVADETPSEGGEVVSPVSWRRIALVTMTGVALAAALLLAFRPGPPVSSGMRSPSSAEIVTELHGAELPRDQVVLSWESVGENAHYRVVVFTSELVELARFNDLTDTEVTVPEDVLAGIPPGGRLLWQVHALSGGESVVSPTFELGLTP